MPMYRPISIAIWQCVNHNVVEWFERIDLSFESVSLRLVFTNVYGNVLTNIYGTMAMCKSQCSGVVRKD